MLNYRDKIENAWNKKLIMVDWLGLEGTIREILSSNESETNKLELIREAVAVFTGRG